VVSLRVILYDREKLWEGAFVSGLRHRPSSCRRW
jgi:hypothetical protein